MATDPISNSPAVSPDSAAPDAGGTEATAETLPGTTVSAGAWDHFQQRMQVRREATCVAALRRAMDAGDYAAAAERARELTELDATWNDVRLFLEDVVAGRGAEPREDRPWPPARPAPAAIEPDPVPLPPRLEPPPPDLQPSAEGEILTPAAHTSAPAPTAAVVKANTAVVSAPPRAPRLRTYRLPLMVLVAFVGAFGLGWTVARWVPTAGRWLSSASQRVADKANPSPIPSRALPARDALNLAPGPGGTLDPLPASDVGEGNSPSQKGNAAALGAPPAALPPVDTPKRSHSAEPSAPAVVPREPARPTAPLPQAPRPAPPSSVDAAKVPSVAPRSVPASPTTARADNPPPAQTTTESRPPGTTSNPADRALTPLAPVTLPPESPAPPPPAAPRTKEGRADAASSSSIGTGAAPASSATTGQSEREADERAIGQTLAAYAQGYSTLNAGAVRRVWPTVNEDELGRAFEQLAAQRVAFSGCTIEVHVLHASATCRGTARYVPRVGYRAPVEISRVWQFSLRKLMENWVIDSVR